MEKEIRCLLDLDYNKKTWIAPLGFIVDGKDGCARKICGWETCHNYGRGFDDYFRLDVTKLLSSPELSIHTDCQGRNPRPRTLDAVPDENLGPYSLPSNAYDKYFTPPDEGKFATGAAEKIMEAVGLKSDEGRLLTNEELTALLPFHISGKEHDINFLRMIAEAQDVKTASVKDAECQTLKRREGAK